MTSCRPAIDVNPQSIQYSTSSAADTRLAQSLGFGDFSLSFTLNEAETRYEISLLNGQTEGNPFVDLDANGNLLFVTGSNYPVSSRATKIYARQIAGSNTEFTLSTTDPASSTVGVTWYLTLESSQILPHASCPLTVNQGQNPTSFSYASSELGIEIEAEFSADGSQLTLARIAITQDGQTSTDTFYNLKLPCVMRGPGCTLLSKAQGKPLIYVVEYALLKFALAKVLFGCYWLCYLTQTWDECILNQLRIDYPSFYLTLESFADYAELFCC